MMPEDVIDEARTWIGTPWKHQGFTKGLGCDCIGLIGGVALRLGVPGAVQWRDNPAFHNYGRRPDPELLVDGCELLMWPVEVPRLADVLLFRFEKEPQHFGFLSELNGESYVIHALAQARRVAENRIDETWRSRIVGAYRFRGLTWRL